jgi:hypothetical protein
MLYFLSVSAYTMLTIVATVFDLRVKLGFYCIDVTGSSEKYSRWLPDET